MTASQFRRIVLGLPGVVEASHMSHPDFRAANGRIFATLTEDETRGMASLTPSSRPTSSRARRRCSFPPPAPGDAAARPMIELKSADAEIVGEAVTLAWQRISAMPVARAKRSKR